MWRLFLFAEILTMSFLASENSLWGAQVARKYSNSLGLKKLDLTPGTPAFCDHSNISFHGKNDRQDLRDTRMKLANSLRKVNEKGPISLRTSGHHPFSDTPDDQRLEEPVIFDAKALGLSRDRLHFDTLTMDGNSSYDGIYSGINARLATLRHNRTLKLDGCTIGTLTIPAGRSIIITNCEIGELTLYKDISRVEISESRIGVIKPANSTEWPRAEQGFQLATTKLASSTQENTFYSGPQSLRNFLAYLESQHNSSAAHLVRADLLHAEYEHETGIMRCISFFYKWSSDFGRSPGRVLFWLGVLIALTIGTGFSCSSFQTMQAFAETLGLSLGYALQTLFNPFSVFGAKNKFTEISNLQLSASIIQAILSLGLYAVFALSVRRRFKVI